MTLWGKPLLDKLTIYQLTKIMSHILIIPNVHYRAQKPATCPYPEPYKSSPSPPILLPYDLILYYPPI